jgi:hypothetical protein
MFPEFYWENEQFKFAPPAEEIGIVFPSFHLMLNKNIDQDLVAIYLQTLVKTAAEMVSNYECDAIVLLVYNHLREKYFTTLNNGLKSYNLASLLLREAVISQMTQVKFSNMSQKVKRKEKTKEIFGDEAFYKNLIYICQKSSMLIPVHNNVSIGYFMSSNKENKRMKYFELIGCGDVLPASTYLKFSIAKSIDDNVENILILVGMINNEYFELERILFNPPSMGADEYVLSIDFLETWLGQFKIVKNGESFISHEFLYPFPFLVS